MNHGLGSSSLLGKSVMWLCLALTTLSVQAAEKSVDFAREVYPILRKSCFECHGPEEQEGELRLDQKQFAFKTDHVIVPEDPEFSELVRRIELPKNDAEVMPARGEPLSKQEIEVVRKWIAQGADWPEELELAKHWSYLPPQRPELPEVQRSDWPKNAIDRFVLARLEKEGLQPAPMADKETLIRRVCLDLIGLPPTPEEVEAFLADDSPDAYEKLVDDLLSRPQFGERWARPWLDLARYADSHGFQRDDLREIWAYRDWVIRAFNEDMPFDEFTIEQIAGDLLPNATTSQKIATGFHRCTTTNVEAGSIPEETRTNQVIDRVNTTAAVWLGTTLECAQCHDHKYDPFSQKDYYRLFAYFNNTEIEADRANPKVPGSIRFLGPRMNLPDPEKDQQRKEINQELAGVRKQIQQRQRALKDSLAEWARDFVREAGDKAPQTHLLEIDEFEAEHADGFERLEDGSILLTDDAPDKDTYTIRVSTKLTNIRGFKLEALTHESLPGEGPGRGDSKRPNFVLNTFSVTQQVDGKPQPIELVKAEADFSQKSYEVSGAIDSDPKSAWAINPQFHKSHWALFQTAKPLGERNGISLQFKLVQHYGGARTIGRLRLSAITGDLSLKQIPAEVLKLARTPPKQWQQKDVTRLLDYRSEHDTALAKLNREKSKLEKEIAKLKPDTTLVMRELDQPRESYLFKRGEWRNPGEPVEPGTPQVLHPTPEGPPNRITLARWLVDRENPLVARVTVNRWWAELFGRGIVATVEDFGIKGDPPTHPQLLDWLAVEFMENGWSTKQILKRVIMSATYRQSSRVTPELLAKDDQNKLLARGPRFRMDAEMIRDNALRIAGLLSLKQFGPPIRPYQPSGIWTKVGGQRYDYQVSPGEDQYRRGIYVVLKRGSPYPSFMNFDASARLACTVKRSRTNTPLQALTLLNDPVYVEAAKAFAARLINERPDGSVAERCEYAFRVCTAREPSSRELEVLIGLYKTQLADARAEPNSVRALMNGVARPEGVSDPEFAAWYAVATTLLNLDETITKP